MKIHFMGISGSGISGIAELSLKMGYDVSGCDLEEKSSYELTNINVLHGHDESHIKDADWVVASPAVFYQSDQNPEFIKAQNEGKLITWQKFLGEYLHKDKKVVCIAGTHGKSTTTAMAINLFEDAGLDPLGTLGAKLITNKKNYVYGNGEYFITEADEFYDNFLNYNPEIIILNNIEFDHPDYFESEKQVFESYKKFVDRLVGKKVLIANSEDDGVLKLLSMIEDGSIKVIKYKMTSDWNIKLKVLGDHNVVNALGVYELGKEIGIKEDVIIKSLENFQGIGRRLEKIYDKNNIKIFDDYAHHPTAIRKTLSGVRKEFPSSRIWAIVEPHGFKRTEALLPLYKESFDSADKVIIGPIFQSRDKGPFNVGSEDIVKISNHKDISQVKSLDDIQKILKQQIKSGDIIIVMGAGKSYIWAQKLLEN